MALQPATCSNCGGSIKVDDVDLNGYGECNFCHTPYKVIDVISIDGLPTVKSLLAAADHAIEDENFEKAVKLFKEIIEIKPNCHEAWWGLYVCNDYFDAYYNYQDKYSNGGVYVKAQIISETLQKYAYRAINYAPAEIAEKYKSMIQSKLDFVNSVASKGSDSTTSGKKECYIATAVYGSPMCRQVCILRRWRDEVLSKSLWGRLFIRCYYALSPMMAKHIRPDSKVGIFIRKRLDKLVSRICV